VSLRFFFERNPTRMSPSFSPRPPFSTAPPAALADIVDGSELSQYQIVADLLQPSSGPKLSLGFH